MTRRFDPCQIIKGHIQIVYLNQINKTILFYNLNYLAELQQYLVLKIWYTEINCLTK